MSKNLEGIASLYLDSNILIYLVEGNAALNDLVLAAFREIDTHKVTLYTSEITITECLNGAYRAGVEELAQKYLELLGSEEFITLLPVNSDVCVLRQPALELPANSKHLIQYILPLRPLQAVRPFSPMTAVSGRPKMC